MRRLPLVDRPKDLRDLCANLRDAPRLAFDTEFIPEHTYVPKLCLIQIATEDFAVAVDTLAIDDLGELWDTLMAPDKEILVHAATAEIEFCLRATGQIPPALIDVQLAAGFIGLGHPLSLTRLLYRAIGVRTGGGEARTDWRKRPLTDAQIAYALDDVAHLLPLWDHISEGLQARGRRKWLSEEIDRAVHNILARQREESWKRVSKAGSLSSKQLAVLREVANWRDRRARKLDKPLKWVMRDDLLVEVAKRAPTTEAALLKVRGLGGLKNTRGVEVLIRAVEKGLKAPRDSWPPESKRPDETVDKMVQKLLSALMIHLAEQSDVAPSLLGSNRDLEHLILWHRKNAPSGKRPSLASGWRAEICGQHLTNFLEGRTSLNLVPNDEGHTLNLVHT